MPAAVEATPAAGSPERIVSLAAGVGETLAALGIADRVVARDETSDVPAIDAAPIVTKAHATSAELVLAQQPEERGTEQRTGRETHQMRQDRGTARLAKCQKERGSQRAQEAAQAGEDDDRDEGIHGDVKARCSTCEVSTRVKRARPGSPCGRSFRRDGMKKTAGGRLRCTSRRHAPR